MLHWRLSCLRALPFIFYMAFVNICPGQHAAWNTVFLPPNRARLLKFARRVRRMSGDPWDDELPSEADLARFDAAVDERSSVTAAAAQLGITQLHDWQRRVVDAWLAGRDALVLSGTGSGKSACYMLPAVISRANGCRGVALVITPLISLARDQVLRLTKLGVSACLLGSGQADASVERRALAGEYSLVFVCPETAHRILPQLAQLRICVLAIDEAHCISAARAQETNPNPASLTLTANLTLARSNPSPSPSPALDH